MSEIKSTLDLVMEKVGELDISPEEKARFKRDEVRGLAQRLLSRYFAENKHKNLSALSRELEGVRKDVRAALAKLLLSSYSFKNPSPENLTGLEIVLEDKGREIAELLQVLTARYQRERNEESSRVEENLLKDLERRGISGSSVQPNAGSDPRWRKFIEKLDKTYGERKKALIKMLSYDAV